MSNKGGLEGAVVADIATSFIDGTIGKLVYAGYAIEDIALNATFEEILFLLHNIRLPNKAEFEELRRIIARNAAIPPQVISMMESLPADASAMAVLRTSVSMLSAFDLDAEDLTDKDIAKCKALRLTGQITTVCAAWMRICKGLEPVAPRHDFNLGAEFRLHDVR